MGSGAATAGFLEASEVRRIFDEHRRGLANHGRLLYALAMFGCWWKDQRLKQAQPRQHGPRRPKANASVPAAAERQLAHA
jgi:hypothetical protein